MPPKPAEKSGGLMGCVRLLWTVTGTNVFAAAVLGKKISLSTTKMATGAALRTPTTTWTTSKSSVEPVMRDITGKPTGVETSRAASRVGPLSVDTTPRVCAGNATNSRNELMIWSALQGNLKRHDGNDHAVTLRDEVEKALAGSNGSANDGGVTRRIVGTILTAMQESKAEVFYVFTANDVTSLPPELMRKGRIDEIWFVDLPNAAERKAIFNIHISKKKRDVTKFDFDVLATATAGFVGAEIEAVVLDSIVDAWDAGSDITTEMLVAAAGRTLPMSVTAKEKIDDVRNWAKTRARAASRAEEVAPQVAAAAPTSRRKLSMN